MKKLTMKDTTKKLRKCPFCKGKLELDSWPNQIEPFYTIECSFCNIQLEPPYDYDEPNRYDYKDELSTRHIETKDWLVWANDIENHKVIIGDLIDYANGLIKI